MFTRKKVFLIVGIFLIGWIVYAVSNKDYYIREHLSNQKPTLFTLQKDLDETNKKLQELNTDYQNLKTQGQAQGAQAAAAMASLKAIPSGSPNKIIPTNGQSTK